MARGHVSCARAMGAHMRESLPPLPPLPPSNRLIVVDYGGTLNTRENSLIKRHAFQMGLLGKDAAVRALHTEEGGGGGVDPGGRGV